MREKTAYINGRLDKLLSESTAVEATQVTSATIVSKQLKFKIHLLKKQGQTTRDQSRKWIEFKE